MFVCVCLKNILLPVHILGPSGFPFSLSRHEGRGKEQRVEEDIVLPTELIVYTGHLIRSLFLLCSLISRNQVSRNCKRNKAFLGLLIRAILFYFKIKYTNGLFDLKIKDPKKLFYLKIKYPNVLFNIQKYIFTFWFFV